VYGNARLEINNTSYKALLFDEFYGYIFLDKFEKALATFYCESISSARVPFD
jgi:hypothetical protein